MRQLENDTVARAGAAPHAGIGPLLEVAAINIAWPLCLIRFGTGIVTGQPMNALQGLLLFALVVLYTLPQSRPRLTALAGAYETLAPLGVEIVAVPLDGGPDAIKRLGAEPRILFPIVTDGAADIVATYGMFARGPAEFLVDRQGYLRTIDTGGVDAATLVANAEALNRERVVAAPPAEHVH